MPKYNVHIYVVVRVRVDGIEADDMPSAITKAEETQDFHTLFDCEADNIEYAEDSDGYLVDVVGDGEYEQSRFYCKDGQTPQTYRDSDGKVHLRCFECAKEDTVD